MIRTEPSSLFPSFSFHNICWGEEGKGEPHLVLMKILLPWRAFGGSLASRKTEAGWAIREGGVVRALLKDTQVG